MTIFCSFDYGFNLVIYVFILQMKTTRFVTINGHEVVPVNDEMSLKKAVSYQPISVMISAANMSDYKSVIPNDIVTVDFFFNNPILSCDQIFFLCYFSGCI